MASVASVMWLGQATLLLTSRRGTRVIIDPWLEGNPKTPPALRDVGPVDLIMVSHGHRDHIADAPSLALKSGAPVIATSEVGAYLESMGIENRIEMNKGGTVTVQDLAVTMVHADHSSGIRGGQDQPNIVGGEPVGFIIRSDENETLYIAGDSNVFGDMTLIHDLYAPRLGFIPIDGRFNMGPYEAAYAVELLGLRRVVPVHYGTFPTFKGTPDDFARELKKRTVECEMCALNPGQSVALKSNATAEPK